MVEFRFDDYILKIEKIDPGRTGLQIMLDEIKKSSTMRDKIEVVIREVIYSSIMPYQVANNCIEAANIICHLCHMNSIDSICSVAKLLECKLGLDFGTKEMDEIMDELSPIMLMEREIRNAEHSRIFEC